MGAALLDSGCTIMCPHGGRASIITSNARVKTGGTFALLATDTFLISGCPFSTAAGPMPCLTIQWQAPSTRHTVSQTAVLLQTSVGLCMNALNAPQGTAIVSGCQMKASGQ